MLILWFLAITLVALLVGASNTSKYGYVYSEGLDTFCMTVFYLGSVATIVSAGMWLIRTII